MTDFDRIYGRIGVVMGFALIFCLFALTLKPALAFLAVCLCVIVFVARLETRDQLRLNRRAVAREVRKRADAQHAAMMRGDWQRGIYGEHQPSEGLQTPPSWVLADQTLQRRIDEGYDGARRQIGRQMRLKAQARLTHTKNCLM